MKDEANWGEKRNALSEREPTAFMLFGALSAFMLFGALYTYSAAPRKCWHSMEKMLQVTKLHNILDEVKTIFVVW